MDSLEDTAKPVIAESERLIQYLHTPPPETWRTPSACDRWEVRDVVTHLAGQGQFYGSPSLLMKQWWASGMSFTPEP